MVRKLLIALILLAAIGGAAYFVFNNKNKQTEIAQQDTAAGSAQEAASAGNSNAPAGNNEFWSKRCEEKGDKYCEVFQRLMIKENNQRLVELAVGYPKDMKGAAQAVIILPLGVVVSDGIALKVDDLAPAKASFRACNQEGCFVVMNLPESFLASMSVGKKITVTFFDGSGKAINVEMSLQGFGSKLNEVRT